MKVMVTYGPGEPVEVELSELSIMAHKWQYDVNIVGSEKLVVVIQSPATLDEASGGFEPHWAFPAFWDVFRTGGVRNLPTIDEIGRSGTGFTHLAGLVNLALKAVFDDDALPHFRYPECHLHPSVQLALADFFIALRRPWLVVINHLASGGKLLKPIPIRYRNDKGEYR